eukprot:GSMAST32.ASY1.ANO1.359.1 assembled CDS
MCCDGLEEPCCDAWLSCWRIFGLKCSDDSPHCNSCGLSAWCVHLDCCGIFCAGLGLFVIALTEWSVVNIVILPWFKWSLPGILCVLVITFLSFMSALCHLRCMLTDPGCQELNKPYLQDSYLRICRHCLNYKTPGVHHCSTCNRCVQRMDHHCPWVNNCVGKYNQKYFLLFLFYVILGEAFAVTMFLSRGIFCLSRDTICIDPLPPWGMLVCIIMCICSIFFLAFVCAMYIFIINFKFLFLV